jgi:hypothetical protein
VAPLCLPLLEVTRPPPEVDPPAENKPHPQLSRNPDWRSAPSLLVLPARHCLWQGFRREASGSGFWGGGGWFARRRGFVLLQEPVNFCSLWVGPTTYNVSEEERSPLLTPWFCTVAMPCVPWPCVAATLHRPRVRTRRLRSADGTLMASPPSFGKSPPPQTN